MAIKHGKGTRVYLGRFDFSGEGRSLELSFDQDLAENTTFTSSAKGYVNGPVNCGIEHRGVFDAADNNWDEWLYDELGSATAQGITTCPSSPTEGDACYNGQVKEANFRRPIRLEDVLLVEGTYSIHGMLGRGKLAAYQTTAKGAHTGTGYDLGSAAATTQMWRVCVHAYEVNLNGGTSYVLKLQESSDNGSTDPYADVAGSTLTCTAADHLVTTINGVREQWVRVTGTPTGGGETAKFAVSVSIVDKQ